MEFKTLIIGLVAGMCLILAMGAVKGHSSGWGRYQCCAAGDDSLAVFVIDTQTGHTWRLGRTDSYDMGTPQEPRSDRQSITPMRK